MPPRVTFPSVRSALSASCLGVTLLLPAHLASAQNPATRPSSPSASHPPVCADGVRRYASLDSVPAPFDTLTMPPGEPIRITRPDQAPAAERQMAARAGSVGATGLVIHDEVLDGGTGVRQVSRRVMPVFVRSDSGRAQAACRRAGDRTVPK